MREIIKIFAAGTILTGYALWVPGLIERPAKPDPQRFTVRMAGAF
jgi:hypothetical protein